MRKVVLFILVLVMAVSCSKIENPEVDPIDSTPVDFGGNTRFEQICVEQFDLDGDGHLSVYECSKAHQLDCSNKSLFSVEGVKNFVNLEALYCHDNIINNLDVAGMQNLKYLYANGANVHSINISGCSSLLILDIHSNFVESIDLSDAKDLFYLSVCYNDRLTALNLSENHKIGLIYCQMCSLTNLDVSPCPLIMGLHCWNNYLTELVLGESGCLTEMWCGDNNLTSLDVSGCPDRMEYLSAPRNPHLMKVTMKKGQTSNSMEFPSYTQLYFK